MAGEVWNVGIFYQADNGDWYEIKKTRLIDRVDNDPKFAKVLEDAGTTYKNTAFVLRSDGSADRSENFNCIEGIDGG